jgi:hypothetical protein
MSKKNGKKMKKVVKSLTASRADFGNEIYKTNCRLDELEPTVRDILWFLVEQHGINPVTLLERGRKFGLVHDDGSDEPWLGTEEARAATQSVTLPHPDGPIFDGPMFTQDMVDASDQGFEDGSEG